MKLSELIKHNLKVVAIMSLVIVLSAAGITYSLLASDFNPIGITAQTGNIGVNLEYLNGSSNNITSNGLLMPVTDKSGILDSSNLDSPNIIKIEFSLSGKSTNPENTIFDIALHDIEMDCELKKTRFRWMLQKNGILISLGNFGPQFDDTILNEDENGIIDRYVLTETQQDLTTDTDTYTLYMWIGERCGNDVSMKGCMLEDDYNQQIDFSNRHFSATLKIEASTKTKKDLERKTTDIDVCSSYYIKTAAPSGCNTYNPDTGGGLIYGGDTKAFITENYMNERSEPVGFEIIGNTGVDAGTYEVIAKLQDGYTWGSGSKKDRIYTCIIGKRPIVITAQDQTVNKGENIDETLYEVSTNNGAYTLAGGQYISSLNMYANTYSVGQGEIVPSGAIILDQYGNDVTSNYDIVYNPGILTVEE